MPRLAAALFACLALAACKRDPREMNPLDLPPAHGQEPPMCVSKYNWACHYALREIAYDCTRECFPYDPDDKGPKPITCGRNVFYKDEIGSGQIKQGMWLPCEHCRWGCMRYNPLVNNDILPADQGTPPNCPYQTHSACVPDGPDPAEVCK